VGTNVEMRGLQIVNEFYTSEQLSSQLKAQGSDGPQYGDVATLEAAKQAFRAAWDRRPKASGNR
jgi:hypothetical protein